MPLRKIERTVVKIKEGSPKNANEGRNGNNFKIHISKVKIRLKARRI